MAISYFDFWAVMWHSNFGISDIEKVLRSQVGFSDQGVIQELMGRFLEDH